MKSRMRGISIDELPERYQRQIQEQLKGPEQKPEKPKERPAPINRQRKMNKTEGRHAEMLEALKAAGKIIGWKYEPFGLRLAANTFYHPDFLVVKSSHFEIHEIKGGWSEEDSNVKVKVAAAAFPWFMFYRYWYKKEGTKIEEIKI